ncbi:MAG: thioesterase family protein [Rhodospirillaceae bacterium]|nr:thioesterase family protein [Rhodospirillaceae bacterium]
MATTIETYRGAVFPWECDWNGHMNVRFYVGKFDEGTWQFMAQIGASREALAQRNCGAMAVSQNIAYKRELVAGDAVAVRTSVQAVGTTSCRFRHIMIETVSGGVAADMDVVGVFVDLATRRPMPIWPELRGGIAALFGEASAA